MSDDLDTAVAAARRRHPSARWPVTPDALRSRVAQALDLHGAGHPDVAAALLEARGRCGRSVEGFAEMLGVDPEVVEWAEAGRTAPDDLPAELRRLLVGRGSVAPVALGQGPVDLP